MSIKSVLAIESIFKSMVILGTYHGKDKAGSNASADRSRNAIASNPQQAIEIYLGRVAKKNKKSARSNQAA